MSDSGPSGPEQWGPPQQPRPDSDWGGGPVQPSMPAGGTHPGYPPPQQPAGQVAVPLWLASDWALATQIALLGQLLLLLGAALVTAVGVLRQIAGIGLDNIDWPATSVRPLVELLGINGAGVGEPLLLTGLLYSYLAYRTIARRHPRTLGMIAADRPRTFAVGVKVGLVSAAVLLVIAILLNSFADDLVLRSPSIAMSTSIDFTAMVFFTVFVGAVPAFFAVLSGARLTLLRFLGMKPASSSMLRGGLTGARRTLMVGGAGLLTLSTLGNLLDRFGAGTGFGDILSDLILTIEMLAVQWLDRAILLLLGASKFLHDGGYLWYFGLDAEAWMWVALPVLAAAYVVGGIAAAKLAGPRTQAEAMRSSVLVGPFVGGFSLLVAIGWAGQAFIDDIVPIAILLPSLWGLLSVGGAWLWASQQGLPSGIVVGDTAQPMTPYEPPGYAGQSPAPNRAPDAPPEAPRQPSAASPPGTPAPETSPGPLAEQPPDAAWGPPSGAPSYLPTETGWEPPSEPSAEPPTEQDWGPPQDLPVSEAWDPPVIASNPDTQQHWDPPVPHDATQQPTPSSDGGPDTAEEDVDLDSMPPPTAPSEDR